MSAGGASSIDGRERSKSAAGASSIDGRERSKSAAGASSIDGRERSRVGGGGVLDLHRAGAEPTRSPASTPTSGNRDRRRHGPVVARRRAGARWRAGLPRIASAYYKHGARTGPPWPPGRPSCSTRSTSATVRPSSTWSTPPTSSCSRCSPATGSRSIARSRGRALDPGGRGAGADRAHEPRRQRAQPRGSTAVMALVAHARRLARLGARVADAILVLNAGSSSLKFEVFLLDGDGARPRRGGRRRGARTTGRGSTATRRGRRRGGTSGAGSGGDRPRRRARLPARLARRARTRGGRSRRSATAWCTVAPSSRRRCASPPRSSPRLEALVPLAPLHQPAQPAADEGPRGRSVRRCPRWRASTPRSTAASRRSRRRSRCRGRSRRRGVRRYGFHGLSYEYVASRAAGATTRAPPPAAPSCSTSATAPACAPLAGGRSIATTMGFTALDGLPMGTRCGSLDPGRAALPDGRARDGRARDRAAPLHGVGPARRVGHLERHARAARARPTRAPGRRWTCSATASGASWDRWPRRWAASTPSSSPPASASTRRPVREAVCRDAAWLGVELDAAANAAGGPRISTVASRVAAWVIPTDEELMIARHTRALLART